MTIAGRIHPSLGLPGDVVLYLPQPLYFGNDEERTDSSDAPADAWRVRVPGAEVLNLFAHRQWRAGMLLADWIWSNGVCVRDKVVLELGAGTGLPSIAAARKGTARFVISTDYDSPPLIATLRDNVRQNVSAKTMKNMRVGGHTWGKAIDDVKDLLQPNGTADVVLLADCIWDDLSHAALIKSVVELLAHEQGARAFVVSGLHTGRGKIESFLRRADRAGLTLTAAPPALGKSWPHLAEEEEAVRKAQNEALAGDGPVARSADLIMEMDIADDAAAGAASEAQPGTWASLAPRLTGVRRTFVVHERAEERRDVAGVHVRNRWITFFALGWQTDRVRPAQS